LIVEKPKDDSKITFEIKEKIWTSLKNKEVKELDVFYWDSKVYSICDKKGVNLKECNLVNFQVHTEVYRNNKKVNFHYPQIYIKTKFLEFLD